MDPVTINGIRLVFGIEADTGMFGDRIAQLAEAVKELDSGAGELLAGLDRLSDGIREYTEGLKAFNEGIGQLSAGAVELDAGAAALRDGLLQMSNQNALLMSGAYAIQQATFDAVNARLKEIDREMPDLTPENYTDMLSQLSQMPGLSLVPGLSEALSDVKTSLTESCSSPGAWKTIRTALRSWEQGLRNWQRGPGNSVLQPPCWQHPQMNCTRPGHNSVRRQRNCGTALLHTRPAWESCAKVHPASILK